MATPVTLTDNDRKILVAAWKCMKNTPSVDNKKLSKLAGYKTPGSASVCYGNVKKKLLAPDGPKLTEKDCQLIATTWQCYKVPPEIDYNKLKDVGGYKTAASASVCFGNVKKKLLSGSDATPTASPKATPVKTAGTKRKAAKKAEAEYESPAKVAKTEAKVKDEKEVGEGGGEMAEEVGGHDDEVAEGGEEEVDHDGGDGEVDGKLLATAQQYLDNHDEDDEADMAF